MTKKAYPFAAGPGENVTESEWSAMVAGWTDNGVFGHPGSPDLTIQPASEPNKIQINVGLLTIDGFTLQVTEPEIIDTVPNGGLTTRRDLIVAELDLAAQDIVWKTLQGSTNTASNVSSIQVPLGYWNQPIDSAVTSEFWGDEEDCRRFAGRRIQPALANSIPPAGPGGLYYVAEDDGSPTTVYLSRETSPGVWTWKRWEPWQSERTDPVETYWNNVMARSQNTFTSDDDWSEPFVCPPSGQVYVTLSARAEANNGGVAVCSFIIRDFLTSAQAVGASDSRAIAVQGGDYSTGSWRGRAGTNGELVAGRQYQIRPYIRSAQAGSDASTSYRHILVEPVYTEVAPGSNPDPGETIDPADVVSTHGGSAIQIPNGDVTTKSLEIKIPSGNRSGAPDTMAFLLNKGTDEVPDYQRVSWFNEYGELRIIPSSPGSVGARFKVNSGQIGNLVEYTDLANAVISGVGPDGLMFGPNLGNTKVHKGTIAPSGPVFGDPWIDTSGANPVLKLRTTGGWLPLTAGALIPDDPGGLVAPTFVDTSGGAFATAPSVNPGKPAGALPEHTLIAFVVVNNATTVTAPEGWTLVDDDIGVSSFMGVYTAPGDVIDTEWVYGVNSKSTIGIVAYTACTVDAFTHGIRGSASYVSTSPSLVVPSGEHAVMRTWWDKNSGTNAVTYDSGAPGELRVELFDSTSGGCSLSMADFVSAGGVTEPAESVTYSGAPTANAQGGGFTIALKSV